MSYFNLISAKKICKVAYFIPLVLFGVFHLIAPVYFEFMVPKFIPGGIFWVYFSGIALTAAGSAIILNIIPQIACFCLLIFVLTFILTVDVPGMVFGKDNFRFIISFLKDISLLSGTFLFYTINQNLILDEN